MAFTFGAAPAASGAGLFGAATPAFGSSTPAFGSSTPAFGADAPAFGSSTPAFGASSPFSFSAPQSSAAFSSGLFGAPSQPALGASQAASQPFGAGLFGASSPSLFGASTPAAGGLFAAPAGQPASSPFSWGAQQSPQPNVNNALVPFGGAPGAGQPQQQQQQSAVNVRALVTTQGSWIHHSTTWDEIHPEGQKQLLEFECAPSCDLQLLGSIVRLLPMLCSVVRPMIEAIAMHSHCQPHWASGAGARRLSGAFTAIVSPQAAADDEQPFFACACPGSLTGHVQEATDRAAHPVPGAGQLHQATTRPATGPGV